MDFLSSNVIRVISLGARRMSSIFSRLQCLVISFSDERRIAEGGSTKTESDNLPNEQMQTGDDQDEADNKSEKPLMVEKKVNN